METLTLRLAEVAEQVVLDRRHFHANPELRFEEHETAAFVAERLRAHGIEVRTAPTGGDAQLDVLDGVARGLSNVDIAQELYLSIATVKTHISNLLAKTGTRTRVQAAVFAYESGFARAGRDAGTDALSDTDPRADPDALARAVSRRSRNAHLPQHSHLFGERRQGDVADAALSPA